MAKALTNIKGINRSTHEQERKFKNTLPPPKNKIFTPPFEGMQVAEYETVTVAEGFNGGGGYPKLNPSVDVTPNGFLKFVYRVGSESDTGLTHAPLTAAPLANNGNFICTNPGRFYFSLRMNMTIASSGTPTEYADVTFNETTGVAQVGGDQQTSFSASTSPSHNHTHGIVEHKHYSTYKNYEPVIYGPEVLVGIRGKAGGSGQWF